MAFDRPSSKNSNDKAEAGKAVAYINFNLPTAAGKERKLGAIALRGDKPQEAELAQWFLTGTEDEKAAKLSKFISKLVVTVQSAEVSEGSMFDLS